MTLIELMITLAILGILVMMAGPGLQDVAMNSRMGSQANEVAGMFQFARAEAARLGRPVRISPLPSTPTTGNEWGEGWLLETQYDGSTWESVREFRSLHDQSTLVSPGGVTEFTFFPNGRFEMDGNQYPDGTGSTAPEVELCDSRSGETGRTVILSYSGQASVRPARDADGNLIAANNPC